MNPVDYAVRDAVGTVVNGTFPPGNPATAFVSASRDISLNLSPADVAGYERVGNDLVVLLNDGQQLVLSGYYDADVVAEKNLYLSENGEIVAADLADVDAGAVPVNYAAIDASGKYSVVDDLMFLDLDRVEPVVAPLAAPLLSPLLGLLAGGTALAAATLLDGDGDGAAPAPEMATPTVDDAGETYLVGGDEGDTATITGTGEPESEVVVTIGDQTQTTTVDDDGTWETTFEDMPEDGVYPTEVVVTDPEGTEIPLDGPNVDIDTTPPPLALTGGVESTGDLVNAEEHEAGAVIDGTGEPGASVTLEVNDIAYDTEVGEDGTWSVTIPEENLPEGEYTLPVTVTSSDDRGNTTTVTDGLVVDTIPPESVVDTVEGDDVINAVEAEDGVVVTGTGEPGATLVIETGGNTQTTTVAEDGTWSASYTSEEVGQGTYDIELTVTSTDAAGNSSTTTHSVHVDTEITLTVDPVAGDNVINGAEAAEGVTVSGTAEPGATVVVSTADGSSKTATAGADGSWSVMYGPGEIAGGTYDAELTVTATDAAGNVTSKSGWVTVDTETTLTVDPVAGDNVINGAEAAEGVTVSGTGEPGATITVETEGGSRTTTVGDDGTWSVAYGPGEIEGGTYDVAITVTATDMYGNSTSQSGFVHVDTETSVTLDPVQGGDGVFNAAEVAGGVALTGTAEPGATVAVTLQGVTQTVTATAEGTWTTTFAAGDVAPGEYTDTVSVVATDAYGNTASTSGPVVIDTVAPEATLNTVEADNVINAVEAADGVTLSGMGEPGAALDIMIGGAVKSTVVAEDGSWSMDYTSAEVGSGTFDAEVTLTSTDAAGNSASSSHMVHIDTETSVSIDPAQAGGDDIVNAAEAAAGIVLTGEAEPGSTVDVTVAGVTRAASVDANGTWTAAFGAGSLPAGEYDTMIEVTSTDAAGNTASASQPIRVDTVAGEVALSDQPIEIDDIINDVERSDGVIVNGTATPGLTVTVTLGEHEQQVVSDPAGNWSINVPVSEIPEGVGTLPITASITDDAGNTSSVSDAVDFDTFVDNFTMDSPIEGDDVISGAERADGVTLTGTVEPGSSVMVTMAGATVAAAVDGAGNWSATFAADQVPQGTMTAPISVSATDAAGNVSELEDTVQIDTEVPLTVDPDQTADDIVNAVERTGGLTLSGTVEPGSSVSVDVLGITRAATVDAAGNWTMALAAGEIPEGTYDASATITATDSAGNTSSLTETFSVDTEIDGPDVDSVTFTGSDVWRIATQDSIDSYSVHTLESDGTIGSPDANVEQDPVFGTEFTFTEPVSDGTNLVVARVDDAGNTSATLVVLEDFAGNTSTLGHAGLADFDVHAINLEYGEGTNLTLTEADVASLSASSNTLTIHGNDDDTVTLTGGAATGETRTIEGDSYSVYTLGEGATLVIEDDITVII